jgi:hypothetical protein
MILVSILLFGASLFFPQEYKQAVLYDAQNRAVQNWREEAAASLVPVSTASLQQVLDGDVARCVKLNNYWCIKGKGWDGQISSDAEGHAAFATAADGTRAAAILLRRYYMEFGRLSSLNIVSRWAPAECRLGGAGGAFLAPRGLQNTLRGRYLASKPKGVTRLVGKGARGRVSVVMPVQSPLLKAPSIAAGMGERGSSPVAASRPAPAASWASLTPAPVSCASEDQRIRNYAVRAVEGLSLKPEDDLTLFSKEGLPHPHLHRLMLNMSAVELGALRAQESLIEVAIAKIGP